MHRGAGQFHAVFQGFFVDFQAVEAAAAERWNQGGVNVDDAVFISVDKGRGEDIQETCQHDQVGVQILQFLQQCAGKGFAAVVFLAVDNIARHAGLGGPLQGESAGGGGNHGGDPAAGDFAAALRVQQGLKVGAAAGHQHNNPFAHFIQNLFLSDKRSKDKRVGNTGISYLLSARFYLTTTDSSPVVITPRR